ncbi:ATPase [Halobacteriales archaeon SW_12_71_31]|nr:MAG: ATPase [Halobacteriales archaeon SW_12_71_31]
MTEFVLYGGKGGVGKTTVSSATALHMAQAGGRVLLVSTDPAHSVGDVFAAELGPEPTRVRDDCELFALEVDPEHRFDEKYADAFDSLVSRAESLGVDVSGVDVDSRGVIGGEEVVVVDLLSRYVDSEWDYVVLDTAPTGHTLRLLKLPEVLDSTLGTVGRVVSRVDSVTSRVSGLLGDRDGDGDGEDGEGENAEAEEPIDYEGVEQRLREVESVLTDPQRTRFRAVMERTTTSRWTASSSTRCSPTSTRAARCARRDATGNSRSSRTSSARCRTRWWRCRCSKPSRSTASPTAWRRRPRPDPTGRVVFR